MKTEMQHFFFICVSSRFLLVLVFGSHVITDVYVDSTRKEIRFTNFTPGIIDRLLFLIDCVF